MGLGALSCFGRVDIVGYGRLRGLDVASHRDAGFSCLVPGAAGCFARGEGGVAAGRPPCPLVSGVRGARWGADVGCFVKDAARCGLARLEVAVATVSGASFGIRAGISCRVERAAC